MTVHRSSKTQEKVGVSAVAAEPGISRCKTDVRLTVSSQAQAALATVKLDSFVAQRIAENEIAFVPLASDVKRREMGLN